MAGANFECLFALWGHSREEDKNGLTVYRRKGFDFPLARGREWIEFKPDGSVLFYTAGPDDRPRASNGTWASAGENKFELHEAPSLAPQLFTIEECTAAILKLRRG